jgi:hypothetical protein
MMIATAWPGQLLERRNGRSGIVRTMLFSGGLRQWVGRPLLLLALFLESMWLELKFGLLQRSTLLELGSGLLRISTWPNRYKWRCPSRFILV